MKERLENKKLDTRFHMGDWRSSASVLGIKKYFEYLKSQGIETEYRAERNDDYIEYNEGDITRERYLDFAEHHFSEEMHHTRLKNLLKDSQDRELNEVELKIFNEKIKGNTVMSKYFKGCTIADKDKIDKILEENRYDIIENTFKNGMSQYRNFCNPNSFLSDGNKTCRVNGYSIDMGKKGKSAGYMQDMNAYVWEDYKEYDFIPFAFTTTWEAFFINNNYNIGTLESTYNKLQRTLKAKKEYDGKQSKVKSALFEFNQESATFVDYDVEVIKKDRNNDHFETIYVRDESIEIFKQIGERYKGIQFSIKVTDKYYIKVEDEVVNAILNLYKLDTLIEKLIKMETNVYNLVDVNFYIYETLKSEEQRERNRDKLEDGETMKDRLENARKTGWAVKNALNSRSNGSQKVKSFKNKLISAISFRDYDAFNLTLMKLSDYSGIIFDFAYELFDNFEENKNLAYAFINALNESENKGSKGDK
ncbi:type I CRISPR-associated protein Cas8a1/Csx8 [Ilyobacter sp.]|uniref:type I CRISPR-associated protein Cas8a1/Csx8 n=1 Tax=Ilyobacter sp. TaxID=3100343 RepID=UPI003569E336